ncbi:hypothetical protein [Streptomyces europaeiscabiei]|uniref:hypothetical protein n=1 Tax=Streptomyces europaeiscabiei TaxID=146819 RepID=UPI0029A3328B|nr:hypothetical protein [Streptomyces europaeiscabiei]MDX3587908.1 hypothetical protein [Streptomyces europaeiscabiei]MDX3628865.1 hypothetical protein [Streptomyces europaeiscabiei]MDX3647011.1 hypothetical protein [Streptomyces europaeiscabiei]
MDPAVIAAIVTSPTALIAAAAAYAAGRHQAHGAHRGPVDAIRRQHQRDAYAALLSLLNTYAYETNWTRCLMQARQELAEAEGEANNAQHHPDDVDARAQQVRARAFPMLRPLRPTLDVVSLEGPGYVADLADEACETANALVRASNKATVMGSLWRPGPSEDPNELHGRLLKRITAFTVAARDYLNGESHRT